MSESNEFDDSGYADNLAAASELEHYLKIVLEQLGSMMQIRSQPRVSSDNDCIVLDVTVDHENFGEAAKLIRSEMRIIEQKDDAANELIDFRAVIPATIRRESQSTNQLFRLLLRSGNIQQDPNVEQTFPIQLGQSTGEIGPKNEQIETEHQQVILLVHGIRTFANWQPMVKRVLEEIPGTKVVPIKYGYFDAFRFWSPLFTRAPAIGDLRREIQNARVTHAEAKISVIAHSFGTYAISKILTDTPDLKLHRLVLSGSIVPRTYRWNFVQSQLGSDVINDYGTRDKWPVLAQCLSWGYGDTGRHGFGRGAYVIDRGHNFTHSEFFNEEFVRNFWKPWFEQGRLEPSPWAESAPPTSWCLSILSLLPLQWLLAVAITLGIFTGCSKYFSFSFAF